jgi:hypothetical protein
LIDLLKPQKLIDASAYHSNIQGVSRNWMATGDGL